MAIVFFLISFFCLAVALSKSKESSAAQGWSMVLIVTTVLLGIAAAGSLM